MQGTYVVTQKVYTQQHVFDCRG